MLTELKDVLHRSRVMKFHHRSAQELQEVLNDLTSVSYLVPGKTKVDVVRDPDDNKIISAALESNADYIVSRDKDLLELKNYQEMSKALMRIKIITPEEFIKILRSNK